MNLDNNLVLFIMWKYFQRCRIRNTLAFYTWRIKRKMGVIEELEDLHHSTYRFLKRIMQADTNEDPSKKRPFLPTEEIF